MPVLSTGEEKELGLSLTICSSFLILMSRFFMLIPARFMNIDSACGTIVNMHSGICFAYRTLHYLTSRINFSQLFAQKKTVLLI
jgi:hypothetical protein